MRLLERTCEVSASIARTRGFPLLLTVPERRLCATTVLMPSLHSLGHTPGFAPLRLSRQMPLARFTRTQPCVTRHLAAQDLKRQGAYSFRDLLLLGGFLRRESRALNG